PTPVEGIDKVINRSNLAGGAGQEDDVLLRTRAKKILDVKGKATLESLRTALEGIEGIQTTPVLIDMPEGVQGVVKAIIDGGDEKEIEKVIEETRAAGIKVEYSRPKMVLLDISIVLVASKGVEDIQKIVSTSEIIARSFVSSLSIGESLIVNQLVSLLLETPGVIDVRTLTINSIREASASTISGVGQITSSAEKAAALESQQENMVIMDDERPYPRDIQVKVVRKA
ncbi:MAG: baseplate J/gp47 family protein, partial [Nitrososphaeraceae archaeon]